MLNFENLDRMRFAGVPPFGIPEIQHFELIIEQMCFKIT